MSQQQNQHTPLSLRHIENDGLCSLQLLGAEQDQPLQQHTHSKREKRTQGMPSVNNFIQKTYAILQEKRFQSIVSWADNSDSIPQSRTVHFADEPKGNSNRGQVNQPSGFKIHNVKAFEEIVLPQYFKHSNMSSFVRQLNMYNFHKVRGDKNEYEFQHQKFIKNRGDLLPQIKRKQVQSTFSIPSISLIPQPDLSINNEPIKNQTIDKYLPLNSTPFAGSQQKIINSQIQMDQSPQKRESSLGKPASNEPQQMSFKLIELQEINRNLKKQKQAKMSILKQLNSGNKNNIINKFNKIIMATLSSKLEQDLQLAQSTYISSQQKNSLVGMHALIDHIIDQSQSRSFKEYLNSTDALLQLQQASKIQKLD